MQFARLPRRVDSPPIVESERDVRWLLNLVDDDASSHGMRCAGRYDHRQSRRGRYPAQAAWGRTVGAATRLRELLRRETRFETQVEDAPRRGAQDVVRLGLSRPQACRLRGAIVRMDLDREIGLAVDEFDEQGKDHS